MSRPSSQLFWKVVIFLTSTELVKVIESELSKRKIPKGEFYKACGITSGHMSNWRRGLNYPQTTTLVKISDFLGVDLLGKKTPATESGSGHIGFVEAKREEINRLLPLAPEWLQDQILALLKAEESGHTSQGGGPKAP